MRLNDYGIQITTLHPKQKFEFQENEIIPFGNAYLAKIKMHGQNICIIAISELKRKSNVLSRQCTFYSQYLSQDQNFKTETYYQEIVEFLYHDAKHILKLLQKPKFINRLDTIYENR